MGMGQAACQSGGRAPIEHALAHYRRYVGVCLRVSRHQRFNHGNARPVVYRPWDDGLCVAASAHYAYGCNDFYWCYQPVCQPWVRVSRRILSCGGRSRHWCAVNHGLPAIGACEDIVRGCQQYRAGKIGDGEPAFAGIRRQRRRLAVADRRIALCNACVPTLCLCTWHGRKVGRRTTSFEAYRWRCMGIGRISSGTARACRPAQATRVVQQSDRSCSLKRRTTLVGIVRIAASLGRWWLSWFSRCRVGCHRATRVSQ